MSSLSNQSNVDSFVTSSFVFRARLGQIKLFSGPYERAHSNWFHFQTHLFKMDFKILKNPELWKCLHCRKLKWSGKIEIFRWRNFWVENRIQFVDSCQIGTKIESTRFLSFWLCGWFKRLSEMNNWSFSRNSVGLADRNPYRSSCPKLKINKIIRQCRGVMIHAESELLWCAYFIMIDKY